MGFVRNAAKSFGTNNKDLGDPIAQMVGNTKRYRQRIKTADGLLNDYTGYVARCIDVIGRDTGRVEMFTEQVVNGVWQRKTHQGMTTILQGTKDSPSLTFMLTGTAVYRQMFGEAFWYVNVLETSRKPVDRLLLYPHRMKVVADSDGKVVGYVYTTPKGTEIPLRPDEIIHFKMFNPSNHMRGVGPLQKAGLYVDAERNTVEYVANFIDNNATPTGIIVLPASTAKPDFDAFEIQWREKYGGSNNAGKTAILQADGVDYKQISSNLKDMQLNDLKQMSIDDILAMFGVSKYMIGMTGDGGLGRDIAKTFEYIHNAHVIDPEAHDIVDTLNDAFEAYYPAEYWADNMVNGKWRTWYDSPIPEDEDAINQRLTSGSSVMSLNEQREMIGLPPVTGGDIIVTADGTEISTSKGKTFKVKVKTVGKSTETEDKPISYPQHKTYEQKESYRLRIQDKQTAYEKRYKKIVAGFIEKQLKQVIEDIAGHKSVKSMMDGNLNPAKQADELTDLSIGVFMDLLQEQGDLAIKYAGGTEKFVLTQDNKNYIRESLQRAHLSYNEDIVDSIGKAVSAGLAEGDSLPQIGKRVTAEYESIKGYKMTRLVRTETLKASNEATVYGYSQLGITQNEWFNNPGACDYCQEVQGMGAISIASNFLAKGESLTDSEGNERVYDYEDIDHPPLHANCRCVILPVRD